MQKSKELLDKTVRSYQNLLEHVLNFKEAVDKHPLTAEEYQKYNATLLELQKDVEAADGAFKKHFEEKTDTLITDTLLMKKRMDIMQEILDINNYLMPRLASLMDVTREELSSLRTGIKQIGGYHSGTLPQSGKIIKKVG